MNENNQKLKSSVSNADSYKAIGEYWDEHSLDEHWDVTSEVEFEVRTKPRHRIIVTEDVFEQIEVEAQIRGVIPEKLASILLAERLNEIAHR